MVAVVVKIHLANVRIVLEDYLDDDDDNVFMLNNNSNSNSNITSTSQHEQKLQRNELIYF